jgi:endoglucanase
MTKFMTNLPRIDRRTFLRATALAAGGMAITPGWSGAGPLSEVPASRLARLATGANVCLWFRSVRGNPTEHFNNYISEDEASFMARLGLKHVRLCVAPRVIMERTTGEIIAERGKQLEAAIERFQRAGLLVIVDIHNEERAAELDPAWQDAFARFWGSLAERLSRFDPEMTMLEIINEPVFDHREEEWNTLNARLARVIRKSAPRHTIITSGPNWGGIDGLKKLKLLPDKNVIYSFHCYDPFPFTHQGATWSSAEVRPLRGVPYPSSPEAVAPLLAALESSPGAKKMLEAYGGARWNKEKLAARFREGMEWGAQNHVPLYCGEFGVFPPYAKPEHRSNWFRDFGQVLAENHIGWAVWGWDEGFGLARKMVNGKPVVDTVVALALGLKPELDGFQQNARLGRGVNILGWDALWQDPARGHFKDVHFKLIREAGFNHVRINLHPLRDGKPDADGKLADAFFKTLDWAVDQSLANGLLVILDFHDDLAISPDPEGKKKAFLDSWTAIAEHCQGRPDTVLFEILNEPAGKFTLDSWNEYWNAALAIIRKSNPGRTVIIGPEPWNGVDQLDNLKLPSDDQNLIATVHYYNPFPFTHQGTPWTQQKDKTGVTWAGTEEELKTMEQEFAKVAAWAGENHRPIYIGEFGTYEKADAASRVRWAAHVAREFEKRGWSWGCWQFTSDFALFDIGTQKWLEPLRDALIPKK